MSDLRINIRFFTWHFQITDNWKFSVTNNSAHKGLPYGWFSVYTFNPFKKSSGSDCVSGSS